MKNMIRLIKSYPLFLTQCIKSVGARRARFVIYSLLIAVTFTHARRRLDGFFVLTTV